MKLSSCQSSLVLSLEQRALTPQDSSTDFLAGFCWSALQNACVASCRVSTDLHRIICSDSRLAPDGRTDGRGRLVELRSRAGKRARGPHSLFMSAMTREVRGGGGAGDPRPHLHSGCSLKSWAQQKFTAVPCCAVW